MFMNIGKYIVDIRMKNGNGKGYWSRNAVSTRAGMSNAYLYQIESGRSKKPNPAILKKLAPALKISYEELLEAAGYAPQSHTSPTTVDIPIIGEIPSKSFSVEDPVIDYLSINTSLIKDKSAFAVKINGKVFAGSEYSKADYVIISQQIEIKNGDLVLATIDNETSIEKYFITEDNIILQSFFKSHPTILSLKQKEQIIIGRVINIIQNL